MNFGIIVLVLVFSALFNQSCTKQSANVDAIIYADKNFNFPPGLPPDPGEQGKSTLLGVDSDHDGIRDDLQRWIFARFPNDPEKRAALGQTAKVFQESMTVENGDKPLRALLIRMSRAIDCLHDRFPEKLAATNELDYLKAKALNTKMRTFRYLEVDKWMGGKSLGEEAALDKGNHCE